MERAVLLSGEHPGLPRAELEALVAVHDPSAAMTPLVGRVVRVVPGDAAATDAALSRMALAHAYGELWIEDEDSEAGIARIATRVAARTTGQGTAAVEAVRAGTDKSPNAPLAERTVGRALVEAGHKIDLRRPGTTAFVWLLDGRAVAGRLLGRIDRTRFAGRALERRAHFSPVGLHPRRAASLVHLARVPQGGRIHDPCCGTGTIVLEAALDGYDAVGSDVDPVMVQGTLQALADDAPEPLDAVVFVADAAEAVPLVAADAVVADLPYGVASGTQREPVPCLYGRILTAVAASLRPGARAVLGCADLTLLPALGPLGLALESVHEERVHRSLTRRFAVIKRIEGVGPS